MSRLEKAGYILIGMSIGIFGATILYDREIRRGFGDDEAYTPDIEPSEDTTDDDEPMIPEISKTDSIDEAIDMLRKTASERRKNIVNTQTTKYTKMYDNAKSKVEDILQNISDDIDDEEDEIPDVPLDDIPDDSADDDLVVERVGEWFEIYLDENPQDFISLVYYSGDDTLCDDREQLISNPEDVVGTVAIERLANGGPGAESGIIFVRNLKTMLNYEIILDVGKYSETVLGIFESNLRKEAGGDVYS